MLTADLVRVRRRGDLLSVVPLGPAERERALVLAAAYLDLARSHVGATRGAFAEACRLVPCAAAERRLALGLHKLVLDRCVFEEGGGQDAPTLRRELFTRAAALRRGETRPDGFARDALVAALAAERGTSAAAIETALYADLPDAHLLQSWEPVAADALVAGYDDAQVQAVLLRAVRVTAVVRGAAPATFRHLFRRLKFLRLLHRIEARPDGGYRIEIDGPFSLFESVAKYGLQLALAFPAIAACDRWSLEAELRWGRDARPLRFLLRGSAPHARQGAEPAALPDDVAALLAQLQAAGTPWRATVSGAVLDLPGVGLCVPDLELTHADTKKTVYLEVLGFWSREAVWKRIELARAGLPHPMVFAVSKHLRVSEEALGDDLPAALYVYSRVLNARAVLERADQAARRR